MKVHRSIANSIVLYTLVLCSLLWPTVARAEYTLEQLLQIAHERKTFVSTSVCRFNPTAVDYITNEALVGMQALRDWISQGQEKYRYYSRCKEETCWINPTCQI